MCRLLGVSPSSYYAWRKRPRPKRAEEDDRLKQKIQEIHMRSRGTYGAPRILEELKFLEIRIGKNRVQRLMRELGIMGASRRRWVTTTMRDDRLRPAPDLVKRDFTAATPNQLWVADITYVPTWEGFLYLAVVMDVFSRRIVGWSMENHLRTELVLSALTMALNQRKPEDVIHHSDQGCQYTSISFGMRCKAAGVRPSMGTVGDCYDNAMCESFFATLECELLCRNRFRSREEAKMSVFEFLEGWYNPHRRHSSLDYYSPMQYEKNYMATGLSQSQNPSTLSG